AVQDTTRERGACGAANDRFLVPIKAQCKDCKVLYARCERELRGLELDLKLKSPVPHYLIVSPGMRMAIEGPNEKVKVLCEQIAVDLVRTNRLSSAACAYPRPEPR
ncbi:MAG: hypothetical protein ACREMA_15255, partial [Longimicrobiales bacterium]